MPITPRCHPSPSSTRQRASAHSGDSSSCDAIASRIRASSCWRSPFKRSRFRAISSARAGTFSVNRSTTLRATSILPAAFMRGAMRNATSVAVSGRPVSMLATSSNARRPGFTGRRNSCSPRLAKMRFSPVSGTASAMVAMATTFRNEGTRRERPFISSSACANLKATPAPHRPLSGYRQSARFGFSTASAFGRPLPTCGR